MKIYWDGDLREDHDHRFQVVCLQLRQHNAQTTDHAIRIVFTANLIQKKILHTLRMMHTFIEIPDITLNNLKKNMYL